MEKAEIYAFIREECEADQYDEEEDERDDVVGECDLCGRELHDYDGDTLAVITADGTDANIYCRACARKMHPIKRVLDNAGLWYTTGYADKVIDSANEEVSKRNTLEQRLKKIRWAGPIRIDRLHHGQRAF